MLIASLLTVTAPAPEKIKAPTVARVATTTPVVVATVKVAKKPIEVKKEEVVKETTEYTGNCEEFRSIISKYQWNVETAMHICAAESGGIPTRINDHDYHRRADGTIICSSSLGLMQISCEHEPTFGVTEEELLDPEKNIEIAYKIYLDGGFHPWTTYHGD